MPPIFTVKPDVQVAVGSTGLQVTAGQQNRRVSDDAARLLLVLRQDGLTLAGVFARAEECEPPLLRGPAQRALLELLRAQLVDQTLNENKPARKPTGPSQTRDRVAVRGDVQAARPPPRPSAPAITKVPTEAPHNPTHPSVLRRILARPTLVTLTTSPVDVEPPTRPSSVPIPREALRPDAVAPVPNIAPSKPHFSATHTAAIPHPPRTASHAQPDAPAITRTPSVVVARGLDARVESSVVLAPTELLPRFRTDLKVMRQDRGVVEVSDPLSGKRFSLYDFEFALAKLLDGEITAAQVIVQGNGAGIPVTIESLSKFVRQLRAFGFLVVPQQKSSLLPELSGLYEMDALEEDRPFSPPPKRAPKSESVPVPMPMPVAPRKGPSTAFVGLLSLVLMLGLGLPVWKAIFERAGLLDSPQPTVAAKATARALIPTFVRGGF
jgi:hypothetical protein